MRLRSTPLWSRTFASTASAALLLARFIPTCLSTRGDRLTNDQAQKAIRALYQTKFFSDVEIDREGDIMVIKVVERPSIAKLTIRGNKDIKTDDLKKGLKQIGLTEGETFDRLALDNVQQELVRQYYNRGKYNVSVTPHVTQLERNRVAVDIEIREGKAAKIEELNIIGNHAFTDKEVREGFESNTPGLLSWYSKDDQYSREKLSGDLEKLQSYYMNRGYADFGVDSTQVSIAPDRRSMYIDASVKEGNTYKIADVKLLGTLILPEATIRQLVYVKPGDLFNRSAIEASTKSIKAILSNIGYAYAKVTPIPKLDKDKRTVDLTLFVEPGQACLCAPRGVSGQYAHRRRSAAPGNAPARRHVLFAGRARPLQDPPAAPGLLQDRRYRQEAGARIA